MKLLNFSQHLEHILVDKIKQFWNFLDFQTTFELNNYSNYEFDYGHKSIQFN